MYADSNMSSSDNSTMPPWPWSFSCFVNDSRDSVSEVAWLVQQSVDFDTVSNGHAIAAILLLLFLTALPWNLFVICAIIKKRIYSQPFIMLMLNLAIVNFLLCVIKMPLGIISGITGEFIFGESDYARCGVCKMSGISNLILYTVSILTLFLMSIDRFLYLKRPLKYGSIVTPRRMLATISAVWVLCIVVSLPPLAGFGDIKFSYSAVTCGISIVGRTHIGPNYIFLVLLTAVLLIPVITLFVMYAWMLYIIGSHVNKRSNRTIGKKEVTNGSKLEPRIDSAGKSDASNGNELDIGIKSAQRKEVTNGGKLDSGINPARKKEAANGSRLDLRIISAWSHASVQLQLVKVFGVIFTANLVTWFPAIIFVAIGAALEASGDQTPVVFYTITYLCFLSSVLIHPILQGCLIREIRMSLSKCHVCKMEVTACCKN